MQQSVPVVPLTREQQQIAGEYFGNLSSNYQRIAALSMPAGNVPVTTSFEIAAAITGILEQAFSPSAGKVLLDTALLDTVAAKLAARTQIPLALINEVMEREIKPRFQGVRDSIDSAIGNKK